MPKRPTDYEDEMPTRVETPLPTRYDAPTRSYHFRDDEPRDRAEKVSGTRCERATPSTR